LGVRPRKQDGRGLRIATVYESASGVANPGGSTESGRRVTVKRTLYGAEKGRADDHILCVWPEYGGARTGAAAWLVGFRGPEHVERREAEGSDSPGRPTRVC